MVSKPESPWANFGGSFARHWGMPHWIQIQNSNTSLALMANLKLALVSMFKSTVALNYPCLVMRLVFAFFIALISSLALAQPVPVLQREALFERAFKSMAFFIYMAENDPGFTKNLSDAEREMLRGIYKVAMQNATLHWMNENRVQRFGKERDYFYVYAITKNRTVRFTTELARAFGLQFSEDQVKFDIDPKLPIRSAVTEADPEKDVFVNTTKINNPITPLDLPIAVSLLMHEFGHKLGDKKNQSAIDTLAAKMQAHLRAMINTPVVNGKIVNLLRFRDMPNYDQWIENILYGEYRGVNIPPLIHQMATFDKQGVYVWVNDNGKITDISDRITDQIRKNAIVQFTDQPTYRFVHHNLIMAAHMTVSAVGSDSFKISINSNLLQFVVPFLTSESREPRSYQLYERTFPQMDSHFGAFFSYEYTLASNNYQIRKILALPKISDRPQFEVGFAGKKQKGNDLELYFSVKGDRKIHLDSRVAAGELWPEIKIKIGSAEIAITASNYYEDSEEFKFVIKDFDKITKEKVSVVGMQLRVKNQMLALPDTDMTARLFLSNEIVLAKGVEKTASNRPPTWRSIQVGDGYQWSALKQNSNLAEGQFLRFVFDSPEILREMNVEQKYSILTETTTSFMGNLIPGVGRVSEPHQRTIHIESQNMNQTLRGNQLHVVVNIDHNLGAALTLGTPVLIDHSGLPSGGLLFGSGFIENNALSIERGRQALGLSFITQSGLSGDFDFKNPLAFQKIPGDAVPGPVPLTNSVRADLRQCLLMFAN